MPIKLQQKGELWTAEVTPPQGQWKSSRSMPIGYLIDELKSIGCRQEDIDLALRETYLIKREQDWNNEMLPTLRLAIAGVFDVSQQNPSDEGFIAYVLFERESSMALWEISDAYDYWNSACMTVDALAWALVRMNARGWLAEHGTRFGLTANGRKAVAEIVGGGRIGDKINRLVEWTQANPPDEDLRT